MIGGQAKIFDHAGHKEATEEDTESRSHIEMVPDFNWTLIDEIQMACN